MSTKPFALLASRSEDVAADDEYASFLTHTGLRPDQLVRIRMESGPFAPLDLDAFSGLFLGGSPFTASVPEAHKSDEQRRVEAELDGVLREVHERDFPFLGLCYGVGALTPIAGGVVDGTYAEQTAAVEIGLTDAGRRDPLLAGLPERFVAYVGHKEACTVLPPGAVLLATSAACPVQMFRLGSNQYVTQFHPELDHAAMVTRIDVYRNSGYFPAEEAEHVIVRISRADVSDSHRLLRTFVERYHRER
ncbi:glutamine amidotransferase [Georgenia yuyongxinii]|uniref:Glutamine amidotransferase n=1 Tax=Georgenia yuyongxinii TaxID=2589797 RepID=A0A552WNI4_9MICO|nr:glutamine amidotransferase [Georgenia yuyongxinii]TRW44254.1 glutamine amidotransferase [Georgenia yuyongxinii]